MDIQVSTSKVCVCINESIICSICLDEQKQPFLSSCNHSFCTPCLVRAAEFKGTSQFPCPLCRTIITNIHDAKEKTEETKHITHLPPFQWNHYPEPVYFEFISDIWERNMISSTYDVISRLKKWNILYNFIPDPNKGIVWTDNAEIKLLMNQIDTETSSGHSGSSMGFTMRNIHFIAKYGYHEFRNEWCRWSEG